MRLYNVLLLMGLVGCVDSSGAASPNASLGRPGVVDAGPLVDPEEPLDTSGLPFRCTAGVVDTATGEGFAELPPGGPVPIGGTGQAGLTARMALRMESDSDPGEVVVELLLTNVLDGTDGDSTLADTPQELDCSAEGSCELSPVLVEISHLAKLPELEGLAIRIDATVRDAADSERVLCRARNHGVLQRLL